MKTPTYRLGSDSQMQYQGRTYEVYPNEERPTRETQFEARWRGYMAQGSTPDQAVHNCHVLIDGDDDE